MVFYVFVALFAFCLLILVVVLVLSLLHVLFTGDEEGRYPVGEHIEHTVVTDEEQQPRARQQYAACEKTIA